MNFASKSFSFLQRDAFLFITNIITSICIARYLGPTLLGVWVIINLIPSYADLFFRTKADAAAVYYLSKNIYDINEVVYVLNILAILSSFIVIIPIILFNDWFISFLFDHHPQQQVRTYVFIILFQIPLNFIFSNYQYLHAFKEDIKSMNLMTITRAISSSAIILILLIFFNQGLMSVAVGSTFGILIAVVIAVGRLQYKKRTVRTIDFVLVKDLLKYGFKLYIANMLSHINLYASQAIVIAYCAPAQVAFFSIAQQMGQLVNKFSDAMAVFLFPRISKETNQTVSSDLASKAYRVTLVMLLPIIMVAPFLFYPLIYLIYGESYVAVVYPFFIILPGLILSAAASNLGMFFQGVGRADLIAKISFVPLIVQIALGLLLVPQFGIIGAALSFLFSLLSTFITQLIVFNKYQDHPFRKTLIISKNDFMIVKEFIVHLIGNRFKWFIR